MSKVKNVLGSVAKVIVFARSAQGKRDIALVIAAVGAFADFLKQAGVI